MMYSAAMLYNCCSRCKQMFKMEAAGHVKQPLRGICNSLREASLSSNSSDGLDPSSSHLIGARQEQLMTPDFYEDH